MSYWTIEDYTSNLCAFELVGKPRTSEPSEPTIEVPPDSADLTPRERLKRDTMLAYNALGGPEYLRRNPELLDKALLKIVSEPVQVNMNNTLVIRRVADGPPGRLHGIDPVTGDILLYGPRDYGGHAGYGDQPVIDVTPRFDALADQQATDAARADHVAAQVKSREHGPAPRSPAVEKRDPAIFSGASLTKKT